MKEDICYSMPKNLDLKKFSVWFIIQAFFLAIIVEKSLDNSTSKIETFVSDLSFTEFVPLLNFFAFIILLSRFSLGAYRYNEERDRELRYQSFYIILKERLLDFMATCIVFALFYMLAINLYKNPGFLKFILIIHLVDILWFLFVLVFHLNEYRSKLFKPVSVFLALSFVTVFLLYLIYYHTDVESFFAKYRNAIVSLVVISVSLFDLFYLRHFYLKLGLWCPEKAKLACAVIESPFKETEDGDRERFDLYARLCMKDCLSRDEAPYASHMLYTQKLNGTEYVLDDSIVQQRNIGIEAGLKWGDNCDVVVVYQDFGITSGMKQGIKRAEERGVPIIYRYLPEEVFYEYFPKNSPASA